MQLSLQTFTSLVQNMAASVQSSAAQLIDLTAGSALRAVLEANASVGLWMQWLIVQVLQTTRAATSAGPDLDSWTADFAFSRLPASAASGIATFSRYTAGASASIPIGSLIRTVDGTQTFVVTASLLDPAYSPLTNEYIVPASAASLDVPVVAQSPGVQGNVVAGTVTLLVSAIQGIDSVTNASALQGGADAEADAAVRTRFQAFIDTRSRATPAAIGFAIASVRPGLTYTLQENTDASGASRPGNFLVTVDDGSGAPTSNLLASVQGAVEAVRPVGSSFSVSPPSVIIANVTATLAVGPGHASAELASAVAGAITSFVGGLPLGGPLSLSRIAAVAYSASSAVTNVYGVTINGIAADLSASPSSVIKPGTVTVR